MTRPYVRRAGIVRQVLALLDEGPSTLQEIADSTGHSVKRVHALMYYLGKRGRVVKLPEKVTNGCCPECGRKMYPRTMYAKPESHDDA